MKIFFLSKNKNIRLKEVTIFALHLGYGGIEQYISSLCKMLKEDYSINLISTYKMNEVPAFEFDKSIKIKYLINDKPNREEFNKAVKSKQIFAILREGIKAFKILILKYYKNIIAIINTDSQYIITTRYFHNNLVQRFANDRIVKIVTEHNFHNNDKKYIHKVVNSIKNFDYFVPVSKTLEKFYRKRLGSTKCVYIPNVFENNSNKLSNLNNYNLINVGRLEFEKNQTELIEIIKELRVKISSIRLYLIGDGSLRRILEDKVKEYHLQDNIIFTGFINKRRLEEYYLNSSLFIMTSLQESFGLALLEAQSYGIPCIAYDCADGAKEQLKNNVGILIKNYNRKNMVNSILKLLNNRDKLIKLGIKGKKNSHNYHIDNIRGKWLQLLDKCSNIK